MSERERERESVREYGRHQSLYLLYILGHSVVNRRQSERVRAFCLRRRTHSLTHARALSLSLSLFPLVRTYADARTHSLTHTHTHTLYLYLFFPSVCVYACAPLSPLSHAHAHIHTHTHTHTHKYTHTHTAPQKADDGSDGAPGETADISKAEVAGSFSAKHLAAIRHIAMEPYVAWLSLSVCVCVCLRSHTRTHSPITYTNTHIYSFCFDLLVASLCPAIFGQELVKAGLLLTLFGGTKRQDPASARTRVRVRSDPHILLVVCVRVCVCVSVCVCLCLCLTTNHTHTHRATRAWASPKCCTL